MLIWVTLSGRWQGQLLSRGHRTCRNPDTDVFRSGNWNVCGSGWEWDDKPKDWFEVGQVQGAGRLPDTIGPDSKFTQICILGFLAVT